MTCPHCNENEPDHSHVAVATKSPTVALIGNPNTGKSTFFNAATGSRQEVRNAPGTTVEMRLGEWRSAGVTLLDLPGTYSLLAKSPDEQVTVDALAGLTGPAPDLAVVILDASSLARSLYLLGQVAQTGTPAVAALTMGDVAKESEIEIDPAKLSELLGIPVVALDPRDGVAPVVDPLTSALTNPEHVRGILPDPAAPGYRGPAGLPLAGSCDCEFAGAERCCATSSSDEVPVTLQHQLSRAEDLFAWVEDIRRQLGETDPLAKPTFSDRVDRVLLHPLVGIPVFAAVMWLIFQLATTVAEPIMSWAESLVTGPVSDGVKGIFGWFSANDTPFEAFVIEGILAGVGVVFSFVPLMAIMFLAIAILDDSGYLARAAFVSDKAMRSIGLDGRALLPLIVGFGCNVPALAGARALPDARQRLITAIIIPYTSCAARLTVYILLASAFFPGIAGTVIFAMYVSSILLVILAGLALRVITKAPRNRAPLLLVLPAYNRPRLGALAMSMWTRTWGFVRGAGKVIVVTLMIVWLLMAIPVRGEHQLADVPVHDSLYGATADTIAPVFAPAGFGSWEATSALITGFVAKEVVVGAFAQAYAVDEPDDPAEAGTLATRIRATFDKTSDGHGGAAALAFMVFVLTYTPCLATVAEQRRMLGTKTTLIALFAQLAVAWLLAVAVFQIGQLL